MMLRKLLAISIFLSFIINVKAQSSLVLEQLSPIDICTSGNDSISFKVTASGILSGSNIVFYLDPNANFNPYNNQGDSIAFVHIPENKKTIDSIIDDNCPNIIGIFIDACNFGLSEPANEYILLGSGNGFAVNDLAIDLPNGGLNGSNADINYNGSACQFTSVSTTMMDSLRQGFCNTTNLFAANPGDFIPADALVIVFTGNGAKFPYNFSGLCELGKPIYVMLSECERTNGAFVNDDDSPSTCISNSSRYRTTGIHTNTCDDELTYDRCGLSSGTNGNYALIRYVNEDTLSKANGGIQNNAADVCNGISLDSLKVVFTITYPIDASFCNLGNQYIKAIVNPSNTYTNPPISNAISFNLICNDISATTNNNPICSGDAVLINNASTNPNATLSWTVSGGSNITGANAGTGNTINQQLTNTSTSIDSIYYKISATDNACINDTSIKIYVLPNNLSKPNLGNDVSYCGSFSQTLSTGDATTTWNTGQTGASITVTQAGTYIATITTNCQTVKDTIVITQNIIPIVNLGADTTFCDTTISLKVPNTFNQILWSTGATSNSITINEVGTYFVTVTENNCKASDTIVFTSNCVDCEYFLPNAFTPNNDGNNDLFGVVNQCAEASNFNLQIFNRWNELIFESNDSNLKWNGYYKNQKMHVDTYLWILHYSLNEKKMLKKGIVTLLH